MINPARLSEFKTVNIRGRKYCNSLDELKEFLSTSASVHLHDLDLVDMGYIEAGHGVKGWKIWLCDDEDLDKMYLEHKNKKKIMLWCYTGVGGKKIPRKEVAEM